MADDSIPFGPIVVVGTVVAVVDTVVAVVGTVVVVVGTVVLVVIPVALVVVDVPDAKLVGAIVTTKVSASAMPAMSTRDSDGPRLLSTLPPRSRRCVEERS
jgi:hypothetical protein